MLFPFGWARHGDWPDLAACRAPSPLLVQYDLDDELFTPEGMAAAHDRLTRIFADIGAPDTYTGQFYPGPHRFDSDDAGRGVRLAETICPVTMAEMRYPCLRSTMVPHLLTFDLCLSEATQAYPHPPACPDRCLRR